MFFFFLYSLKQTYVILLPETSQSTQEELNVGSFYVHVGFQVVPMCKIPMRLCYTTHDPTLFPSDFGFFTLDICQESVLVTDAQVNES